MIQCDANGNTFLVMENKDSSFSSTQWFKSHTCSEDGVIWLYPDKKSWHMEYYNCDGSCAAMCGNGARSALYYLYKKNYIPADQWVPLKTNAGEVMGIVDSEGIPTVSMPTPVLFRSMIWNDTLVDLIKVGVPHVARQLNSIEEVESFDLKSFFYSIREHDLIPGESNVNVFCFDNDQIWLRTFENGVNRETKSCGTGCVAVAYLLKNTLNSEYDSWTLHTQGGNVTVSCDAEKFYLKGQVNCNEII
ncbi:MAG TPA: diaminopimelate epimerase [Caldisericia bacterium]|jgi:diaminopimelate epimerase|nr:diaminopimelate epimerase [Caldisericia bacterium]HXK51802.1 diaminopimelate epimerase [Caldisericia bacterium]